MPDARTLELSDTLILDRKAGHLHDMRGAQFDPLKRQWRSRPPASLATPRPPGADVVSLGDAIRWLQRDSGHPLRVPIGVVGPRAATPEQLAVAEALGEGLADRGYLMICGGREGVMEAACRGVAGHGGIAVGLTPDADPDSANPHVSIAIATGLGEARNAVIARASFCLLAVGDSFGTLSEVALGLHFGKRVFGLVGAADLAGVDRVATAAEALARVDRLVLGIA
ncbi:MAG: TIGR00725 family protein [Casimicrobiaceae bacterium]